MRWITVLLLFSLAVAAVFVAANWQALATPTTVSLIAGHVEAPLGLLMLGFLAALAAVFLLYVAYVQSTWLVESRRHSRELTEARRKAQDAADNAISRLGDVLTQGLEAQSDERRNVEARMNSRVDALEKTLRDMVEQHGREIAAQVGFLDDRIDRWQAQDAAKLPSR